MTPIMKMLLRFIKENTDGNNEFKWGNKEISKELGVHEISISRCVGLLKKQGEIETVYSNDLRRTITIK